MIPTIEHQTASGAVGAGQGTAIETWRATSRSSLEARARILGVKGEPLFHADWLRALFIHYEVDPAALQRAMPFELDLHEGRAYVSLVAFTMRNMRPRLGGKLGALLFGPIATHEFLNLRAYVKHHGEAGIHFLAEWLSNPISVRLGPLTFGLPYRYGRIQYHHHHEKGTLQGRVDDGRSPARLEYATEMAPGTLFQPCAAGLLDEFLLERYTAFTVRGPTRRFFRIWHPPWLQTPLPIVVHSHSLLTRVWPWFSDARVVGANYTPGVEGVWMGRPHRI